MNFGPQAGDASNVGEIFETASEGMAKKIFIQVMKNAASDALSNHDPEVVHQFIEEDHPLVEEELPEEVKDALRQIGPRFENVIYEQLRVENVKMWMGDPHWVDDRETYTSIVECYEIIEEHPNGDEWLHDRLRTLWSIALDYPGDE